MHRGRQIESAFGGLASLAFGGAALVSVAQSCLYTVDGGERAIIFNRLRGGIQGNVIGEGMHFRVPWVEQPFIFDIRTRPRSISTTTGSKDLQMVNITLRVLFRPRVEALPSIYQKLGKDYDERVFVSIGNEILKAVVAQYNAEELITRREFVSKSIADLLSKRAAEFDLVLDDISITHLNFGREFTQAVENKQVAQQDAERSRFFVLKAEQEKKAAVIRAEGESEAAKLINDALKSGSGIIDLRKIEAAKDIAEALSTSRNVVYIPSSGNVLMSLPNTGGSSQSQ
ncbi:mitochondrial prohibitin 1 (Phb1) [Andalucia godoyi]|uniref:Prohibitin n=1 Tax=Andalucia godoyi TaxID=505711 RepID=A0A8K0AJL2_ANDGO|nr:mitochondrial prohibitin 1 (Phb1) [Andalucia godoyi]|eukprot:ANDGO_02009.mRNA.1 mitochondrial prohibitin 1 (Phb1)